MSASYCVYILYSESIDRYYVGHTSETAETRLHRHNTDYYEKKYTRRGKPWKLYVEMPCGSRQQAMDVEQHIKQMKSRKYIENLNKYPEMREKLLERYS
ncbi:MAG: GIY-YIG nuclease family protein [Bacteroidetes bacterium]|nr:GIY-YIG nuclease family protein [Bacteroidota bacterium]